VRQLGQTLAETQSRFAYDTLRLPSKTLGDLAGVLVDFAEDIHAGTGIWASYERYNVEFFGIALPITLEQRRDPSTEFSTDRFHHFLWVLYPTFIEDLTISPTHQDLRRVADAASSFLSDAFDDVSKESDVKSFLASSDEHGWDVKRKLIWLGTHSFMFRTMFARYLKMQQDTSGSVIGQTDDFVCQECTRWSGLGVIDILAGVLDVSDDDRRDLRNWYERHAAFYKILSVEKQTLEALNVINDRTYRIKTDMKRNPFRRGQIVFGSLVPWRGEWYWSGEQKAWTGATKLDVDDLKRDMKRRNSRIVCRYWKEYETQVRERASAVHERMLAFHGGKDLVVYPDGLAMAADWQREIRAQWEAESPEETEAIIKKYGLKKGRPDINLPQDLLEQKDGLGVFLNPDEGKEIMTHFTTLVAGLRKRGEGLTGDEEATIRGFVESGSSSPRFVRRVLEEFGSDSVRVAFVLKGDLPAYWLDYLLRSCKGHYYRKRFPALSVV
jgi:hypothetical protein